MNWGIGDGREASPILTNSVPWILGFSMDGGYPGGHHFSVNVSVALFIPPFGISYGVNPVGTSRVMWSSTQIDDWGLAALTSTGRLDLLEVLEDRTERASMLITSQVPVRQELIGEPTIADSICDRLIHAAYVTAN